MEFYKTKGNVIAGFAVSNTENREKALKQVTDNLQFKNYFFANQIHSNKILIVGENTNKENGDGIICTKPDILIGIFTADCVPVTIYNNSFIAIIHAGWRGFANNIFNNFFKLISNYKKETLNAIIGPCICQDCYEVSYDVAQHFKFITETQNQKYLLNLKQEALLCLTTNNIKKENITVSPLCTYCSKQALPSYRKNKTNLRIVNFAGIQEND